MVDVGGGSTELVLGDGDGGWLHAGSADVGSVRLTERHLAADPPTPAQRQAAEGDVERALAALPVRAGDAKTLGRRERHPS